ncbi:MAG TPA: hypothetical protein VHV53_06155 [Solirubrobacterales bacterium]|jgi:hypothetical protein|nr:hypothetical protein [Solirubrobacterales bacterium]
MKHRPLLLSALVLLGLAVASQVAFAAPPSPAASRPGLRAAPFDDESEFEESEFELEECEAEEFEDGEEFEDERFETKDAKNDECGEEVAAGKGSVSAPPACLVRRAESKIATLPASDHVLLTVRYQTYESTKVTVGLKLKDHKGSLAILHATKHLSGKGVLQLSAKVGKATMERVLEASEFDVSLRAPDTPDFCAGDLEQRLHIVKHGDKG